MNKKSFRNYYLFCILGALLASYYPLSMGVRVVTDMIIDGTVLKENYPKYIIPYTPISLALIIGVLLLPLCIKLHFYIISGVLILSVLNCFYGFGQMIATGEKNRLKSLILQSISSIIFLGLCILACFTAFFRDGNIQVSPLSALLMAIFFILLGVTTGIYTGSFLLGKRRFVSTFIPAIVSSVMTLLMYIGEMILLNSHLYQFGTEFLFDSMPGIILAPVDLLIIAASGCITALMQFKLSS